MCVRINLKNEFKFIYSSTKKIKIFEVGVNNARVNSNRVNNARVNSAP